MSVLHSCKDGSEFATRAALGYRKVELSRTITAVEPHRHLFDHDMIVVSGKVFATCDGVEQLLQPGDVLTVPASAIHAVRICPCVDTATFFCVWPIAAHGHEATTQAVSL